MFQKIQHFKNAFAIFKKYYFWIKFRRQFPKLRKILNTYNICFDIIYCESIRYCILENIVITLCNRMKKNNEAILFTRSILINENFLEYPKTDDENLLELIEKHKGHVYIGGNSLLWPNNVCSYNDRYNNAVNGLSKKHDVGGPCGIFIDPAKVKIFVKNIKISRDAQTIQDSGAIEVNGLYKYKLNGIETACTKEELEEYLKLNESVLTISADVGYDIAPETKVDFIYMK